MRGTTAVIGRNGHRPSRRQNPKFELGKITRFEYPSVNRIEEPYELVTRRVLAVRMRDLLVDPLSIDEYCRRPLDRISRWMLLGVDPDTGKRCRFYLGSIPGQESPGMLRVGLFHPDAVGPWRVLLGAFGSTQSDRRELARLLRKWEAEKDLRGYQLGVFCNDLRLVAA